MSVLIEYSIFPTDKGESVSSYVSRVIDLIRGSGYPYKFTAMGTVVETPTVREALDLVARSYDVLDPDCNRVFASIKLDIRKNKDNRLEGKVKSVEEKIGKVNT